MDAEVSRRRAGFYRRTGRIAASCPALCRTSTGFLPLTSMCAYRASALEPHAGDRFEVAVPDLFLLGLRHVDALDDAQSLARVHRALLRIERAVGGEHDLFEVVERDPRMRRRDAAEHGGVGIK